jgi:hypothetical protein
MEALAGEMEKMFFEMELHRDHPSSSADGAGASGANAAGDDSDTAREMESEKTTLDTQAVVVTRDGSGSRL